MRFRRQHGQILTKVDPRRELGHRLLACDDLPRLRGRSQPLGERGFASLGPCRVQKLEERGLTDKIQIACEGVIGEELAPVGALTLPASGQPPHAALVQPPRALRTFVPVENARVRDDERQEGRGRQVQPADANPIAERRQPGDEGGAGEHREPQVRHEQVTPHPLGEGRAPTLDPPPILVVWGHVVMWLGHCYPAGYCSRWRAMRT